MFKIIEGFEREMIPGPGHTIPLTMANISLMRTQITSGRRYMIQNDFKLIKYSIKNNKNGNKQNSTLGVVGFSERILKLFQLRNSNNYCVI
jgi:hypothetical protein